jgi:hypothetical protein
MAAQPSMQLIVHCPVSTSRSNVRFSAAAPADADGVIVSLAGGGGSTPLRGGSRYDVSSSTRVMRGKEKPPAREKYWAGRRVNINARAGV